MTSLFFGIKSSNLPQCTQHTLHTRSRFQILMEFMIFFICQLFANARLMAAWQLASAFSKLIHTHFELDNTQSNNSDNLFASAFDFPRNRANSRKKTHRLSARIKTSSMRFIEMRRFISAGLLMWYATWTAEYSYGVHLSISIHLYRQ